MSSGSPNGKSITDSLAVRMRFQQAGTVHLLAIGIPPRVDRTLANQISWILCKDMEGLVVFPRGLVFHVALLTVGLGYCAPKEKLKGLHLEVHIVVGVDHEVI